MTSTDRVRQNLSILDDRGQSGLRNMGLTPGQKSELNSLLVDNIDYIDDPFFAKKGAQKCLFENSEHVPEPDASWFHVGELSDGTRKVSVVLKAEQERLLFLQFNFARMKAAECRRMIREKGLSKDRVMGLLNWNGISMALRDKIWKYNLGLPLAMVKRFSKSGPDFDDMVEEANLALKRSIDKFNVSKGFKFSTYACRAILGALSRMVTDLNKERFLFPISNEPGYERSNYQEEQRDQFFRETIEKLVSIVMEDLADLTDVEKSIILLRFPIGSQMKGLTLEQTGKIVGLTKERVRQIQKKALGKLRITLEEQWYNRPGARKAN